MHYLDICYGNTWINQNNRKRISTACTLLPLCDQNSAIRTELVLMHSEIESGIITGNVVELYNLLSPGWKQEVDTGNQREHETEVWA